LQATRQQLLEAFTKHNVPINARDMNGKTALHYALYKDINNQDWASPLLKVGINPNIQDNLDTSALALVVSKTDNNSLNLDLVNLLLDNKANPNLRDSLGETVLFKAYRINNQDLIKLLLAKGANPTIKNYYGKLASETE
jgi:ankyrin repeat protein